MPRVLMLGTGGALAMEPAGSGNRRVLRPSAIAERIHEFVPELERLADIEFELVCNRDSSEVSIDDWFRLARIVFERIHDYDGFVITHGTDTMAYTATALSFALRDLPKPVVLTGAQKPLGDVPTDAHLNLVGAVETALLPCGEVGICFGNRLFRGNRCTKVDSLSFDAFHSPNEPPLAELGIRVRLSTDLRQPGRGPKLATKIEREVMALAIHPGFDPRLLATTHELGARGLVLLGLGSGNVPIGDGALLHAIESLIDEGTAVVMASQVPRGRTDLQRYEGSARARELGVLSSYDMTFEATLIKLMFGLAETNGQEELARFWHTDLAGEFVRLPPSPRDLARLRDDVECGTISRG